MDDLFNYLELAADDCKYQLDMRKEEVAKLEKLLAAIESLKSKTEIQNPKAKKSSSELKDETRISFLKCLEKVKTYYPDGSYLHMSGFLKQLDEILKAVGITA